VLSPELEARWVLQAATGRTLAELVSTSDVDDSICDRALDLAWRRAAGEPLQYVTGVAGFRRIELAVGPGVFIPRPETELVAERAMQLLPKGGTVVDVGTGSGAIALAIADERPDATVLATESSPHALEWARKNAEGLNKNVSFYLCDLLSGLPRQLLGMVQVVVSNPPYVPRSEKRFLPSDVAEHEPPDALFAPGNGLSIITRLARDARPWLTPGSWLVVEIGDRQGAEVAERLSGFDYEEVSIRLDLAGRERIAEARVPPDPAAATT
jgi:release factor glutamine methyltransferase